MSKTKLGLDDFSVILPAPFGAIGVLCRQETLLRLEFLPAGTPCRAGGDALSGRVAGQLNAYFADPNFRFDLPYALHGSPFRQRVWQALQTLAPGQVASYGELARQLGTAARAVGQALGDNPLPIVIPCHRVVAAGGVPGACRTLGSDSENGHRRDQFSTISPGNSRTIAQEMGEKWAGEVGLQPEIPKSDRLLGGFNHSQAGFSLDVKRWLLRHEGVL